MENTDVLYNKEETPSENEGGYRQIFGFLPDTRAVFEGGSVMSAGTIRMVRDRLLTDNAMMAIQLLYEIGPMTAYEFDLAMDSELIPEQLKKFASGKRSAYRNVLSLLCENGIVRRGVVFDGKRQRLKFYELADPARKWYETEGHVGRGSVFATAHPVGKAGTASPKELSTVEALSSSMFHICEVKGGREDLVRFTRYYIDGRNLFDAFYEYADGTQRLLLSVRGIEADGDRAARALMTPALIGKSVKVIFQCPGVSETKELYDFLKSKPGFENRCVLFASDVVLKGGERPVLYYRDETGYYILDQKKQ